MGATIVGKTIYISPDLIDEFTPKEILMIKAHELGHYFGRHRLLLIPVVVLFFWCPPIVNAFKRWLEIRADLWAITRTKDIDSFISCMHKLTHDKNTHPTKEARLKLAESMRGKL